jgi:NAD(P)-dependent dehydrogenase (short-subunit alcohol dehydrogenase family)
MAAVHTGGDMNTDQGRRFAVITGGSSGIGYEFAKVCAAEGFEVLIVAEQGLEEASPRQYSRVADRWMCWR